MKNPITSPRAGLMALLVSGVFLVLGTLQASIVYSGCSSSSSCTLGELFSGGSIQVDDLLFSDFAPNTISNSNDFAGVSVSGVGEGTSSIGLLFESITPFSWLSTGSSIQSSYRYNVGVSGGTSIVGRTVDMGTGDLTFADGVIVQSYAYSTGGSNSGSWLGGINLPNLNAIDPTVLSTSFVMPAGANGILIRDNVGFTGLSKFESYQHTFDTVTPVPVPAAVWLLGSGLFGLIGLSRLRRKQD